MQTTQGKQGLGRHQGPLCAQRTQLGGCKLLFLLAVGLEHFQMGCRLVRQRTYSEITYLECSGLGRNKRHSNDRFEERVVLGP